MFTGHCYVLSTQLWRFKEEEAVGLAQPAAHPVKAGRGELIWKIGRAGKRGTEPLS